METPLQRWFSSLLFAAVLTACAAPGTPTQPTGKAPYPDLGAAPELAGDAWLNTSVPLRLANLRGKVVLVDRWTFG